MQGVKDFFVLNPEPYGEPFDFPADIAQHDVYFKTYAESDFELQQVRVSALLAPGGWTVGNRWLTNLPLMVELEDSGSGRTFLPWTLLENLHLAPMPEPRLVIARSSIVARLKKTPLAPPLFSVNVALFGRKVFRL